MSKGRFVEKDIMWKDILWMDVSWKDVSWKDVLYEYLLLFKKSTVLSFQKLVYLCITDEVYLKL